MKHIFKQTSSIVVGLLMCTACNNWLDIQPSDRIAEDRVFSQVSGFWGALNGVYTELLSSNLYGGFLTVQFGIMYRKIRKRFTICRSTPLHKSR